MKHSHSSLDNLIAKTSDQLLIAHEKIKHDTVIFEAGNFATKNLPAINESSFKPYLATIEASYTGLKKDVSVNLEGGIQKVLGAVDLGTSNQKIDLQKKSLEKAGEKITHLNIDRNRINLSGNCTSYLKYRDLLLLLAFGEVLWVIAGLLNLGDIMLLAIGLGIVIGIAQISAVKTATQIIKEIKNKRKQKLYTIIASVAFSIFSLSLGMLRYWFIHIGTGSNIPFIVMNPFTFVAINMLFIVATALIVIFFYPTKEEVKQIHMKEAIDKKFKDAVKQKQNLESDIFDLMNERQHLMEIRIKRDHAEKKLHEKIDAFYDEAIGVFKHENIIKRRDGAFPLSFKSPHDPLPHFDSNNLIL